YPANPVARQTDESYYRRLATHSHALAGNDRSDPPERFQRSLWRHYRSCFRNWTGRHAGDRDRSSSRTISVLALVGQSPWRAVDRGGDRRRRTARANPSRTGKVNRL